MTIKKRVFAIILSITATMCCMLSACKDNGDGSVETQSYTDIDLVQNHDSDYVVVIPAQQDETIEFAASELVTFFEQATEYTLQVKTDESISYNESQKIISIGDTTLWRKTGIQLSFEEFGYDGAFLTRKGSQVFLAGAEKWGALNAVYTFLSMQFNYEAYSRDEIYVDKVSDAKLINYKDVKDIPSIISRFIATNVVSNDPVYAARMRCSLGGQRYGAANREYADTSHTLGPLMPYDTYAEAHSDWYAISKQLCFPKYFTDPEFKQVFLENLMAKLRANPESTKFQLGMNDNTETHDRTETEEWTKERGGYGGAFVAFANAVADDINDLLAEEDDPRAGEFGISILAYHEYEPAPVRMNETTKKYEVVHPDAVANKNVSVMLCLFSMNNAYSVLSDKNSTYKVYMEQWSAVTDNLEIWYYSTNFSNYLIPYNNFQTYKENAIAFEQYNVRTILENNCAEAQPFRALKTYLWGKLLWNPHQDVNELVDNFIYYYYKEAAPYIKEYYELLRTNYAVVEQELAENNRKLSSGMYETIQQAGETVFPLGFTKNINNLIDQAIEAASNIQDEARKDKILFRCKKEALSPRYFIIELHSSSISKTDVLRYIDEFEEWAAECNLTELDEGAKRLGTPAEKIASWRMKMEILGG